MNAYAWHYMWTVFAVTFGYGLGWWARGRAR